jgi:hypothetical protein
MRHYVKKSDTPSATTNDYGNLVALALDVAEPLMDSPNTTRASGLLNQSTSRALIPARRLSSNALGFGPSSALNNNSTDAISRQPRQIHNEMRILFNSQRSERHGNHTPSNNSGRPHFSIPAERSDRLEMNFQRYLPRPEPNSRERPPNASNSGAENLTHRAIYRIRRGLGTSSRRNEESQANQS